MSASPAAIPDKGAPPSGLTERAAILLAVVLAAIPYWRALVPGLSYYFRDFSVTFYPLRLFQARELAQGRLPFWNPYIHQGSFVLPALYPLEFLHVFWSGPAAVSWLLTLHVPLAGLAAYALARELGARRPGAVVGAALYALGGLAASSLNLYVFLQALAWAPAVAAAARRAAVRGGRWAALLALATAVSLTTMAVEFVAQAVLLGIALGAAASPTRRALARMAAGFALGAALAAVPLDALEATFAAGFDPARDAVLEGSPASASCQAGMARRREPGGPDADAYDVEADGPALLVTRDRYARGWTALVDGRPAPVLRANGPHRAVAVPAGRHQVRFEYVPPGLEAGILATAAAVIGILGVVTWPRIL